MNIKKYLDILAITDLFKGFTNEDLLNLFDVSQYTITKYKRDSIIHFEGEKCSTWDIILEGQVIVQKIDENGKIFTITEFRTGDSLGDNLLFSRQPYYPMSVLAKSDTEILHINKELVVQLCQNNKNFLLQFLTCISDKASILTSKIKSISMKTIREAIIDFLNYEYYSQKSLRIKLPMTKKELAERLGIQRTSLFRELSKMKRDELIDYDPYSITIRDTSIIRKV